MRLISATGFIGFLALSLGSTTHAMEVEWGGHVDAQFNYIWVENDDGYAGATVAGNGGEKRVLTFRFNEGSVFLNPSVSNYELMLDLDLRGPSMTESLPFNTGVIAATVDVGQSTSQAYVAAEYDNGFSWMLGQFDSRYGYEANDSSDYRYTQTGVLYNAMPLNHVGLLVAYGISEEMSLELVFGNTYDQGHMKEGNFDIGAKFRADMGAWWVNLGVLGNTGNHDDLGGVEKAFGYISDLDLGFDVSGHTLAIFAYYKQADIEDVKADLGVGVDFGHDPDVGLGYGLRLEYEKDGTDVYDVNTPAAVSSSVRDDATWQVTVGPQWHFHKDLVGKIDYSYSRTSFEGTTGVAFNDEENHAAHLGVVYSF